MTDQQTDRLTFLHIKLLLQLKESLQNLEYANSVLVNKANYSIGWCKGPGKNNNFVIKGTQFRSCKNPDRPCDFCACDAKSDEFVHATVKEDGCKKPPSCRGFCRDSGDHPVNSKWKCWLPGWR